MATEEEIEQIKQTGKTWLKRAGIFVLALALLGFANAGFFYDVDRGEKGVEFSRSDGVKEHNYGEGLQLKWPIWEKAKTYDVRERTFEIETSSPTNERQEIFVRILVTWHINRTQVWQFHKYVGEKTAEKKLADATETKLKAATVQRTVHENLLDRQQDQMVTEVDRNLSAEMEKFYINVTSVEIPNISPSDAWIKANEEKVIAKENAIEAEHREREAAAQANQTALKANGTARAIEQVTQQLRESPLYIRYLFVDKWNGVMPKVVAGGQGNGSVVDMLVPMDQSSMGAEGSLDAHVGGDYTARTGGSS